MSCPVAFLQGLLDCPQKSWLLSGGSAAAGSAGCSRSSLGRAGGCRGGSQQGTVTKEMAVLFLPSWWTGSCWTTPGRLSNRYRQKKWDLPWILEEPLEKKAITTTYYARLRSLRLISQIYPSHFLDITVELLVANNHHKILSADKSWFVWLSKAGIIISFISSGSAEQKSLFFFFLVVFAPFIYQIILHVICCEFFVTPGLEILQRQNLLPAFLGIR